MKEAFMDILAQNWAFTVDFAQNFQAVESLHESTHALAQILDFKAYSAQKQPDV
jgi:hypothetical protein